MKRYTLKQLFNIVDGRLATKMEDIYDILGHVCNEPGLMTHHLPVAKDYIFSKHPEWITTVRQDLNNLGITDATPFPICMELIDLNPKSYDVPQLSDLSDFGDYMVENSILLKKFA